jgi:hypothetical protein
MDGSRTVRYQLKASSILEGWLSAEQPVLVASCSEHKIEAYLVTNMPLSPELGKFQKYTVRLRFDSGSPRAEQWSESTDGKAVFAPSPLAFLKRVAKAKLLRMEVTPFRANPGVATFEVDGFVRPLKQITDTCQ